MRGAKLRSGRGQDLHSGPPVLYPLNLISVKPGPTLGGEVSSPSPARKALPEPPSLGNPAVEGRDWASTHRRISCLVRNVRS